MREEHEKREVLEVSDDSHRTFSKAEKLLAFNSPADAVHHLRLHAPDLVVRGAVHRGWIPYDRAADEPPDLHHADPDEPDDALDDIRDDYHLEGISRAHRRGPGRAA